MRRLMLMRHGKAELDAPGGGGDHERPLAERGRQSAEGMGRLLTQVGEVPDLALTSTALRARQTAELAHEAGQWWSCPLDLEGDFYGASPGDVLEIVALRGGDAERLLVVGHDPTWSQLLHGLTGARADMATASVAGIDLLGERWDSVTGTSLAYLIPGRMAFNQRR